METTTSETGVNQINSKIFWSFLWQFVRVYFGALIAIGLVIFWSLVIYWLIKRNDLVLWVALRILIPPACVYACLGVLFPLGPYYMDTDLTLRNYTNRLRMMPVGEFVYWSTLIAPLIVWVFRLTIIIISKAIVLWRRRRKLEC